MFGDFVLGGTVAQNNRSLSELQKLDKFVMNDKGYGNIWIEKTDAVYQHKYHLFPLPSFKDSILTDVMFYVYHTQLLSKSSFMILEGEEVMQAMKVMERQTAEIRRVNSDFELKNSFHPKYGLKYPSITVSGLEATQTQEFVKRLLQDKYGNVSRVDSSGSPYGDDVNYEVKYHWKTNKLNITLAVFRSPYSDQYNNFFVLLIYGLSDDIKKKYSLETKQKENPF